MASQKRSKCRLSSDADSEIPALGLDSAHLNVDCDINPARVVKAATRVAKKYGDYRRRRKQDYHRQPHRSSSTRKRTKINIDTEYERAKHRGDDNDEDNNDEDN